MGAKAVCFWPGEYRVQRNHPPGELRLVAPRDPGDQGFVIEQCTRDALGDSCWTAFKRYQGGEGVDQGGPIPVLMTVVRELQANQSRQARTVEALEQQLTKADELLRRIRDGRDYRVAEPNAYLDDKGLEF